MDDTAPWLDYTLYTNALQSEDESREHSDCVTILRCKEEAIIAEVMSTVVRVKVEYTMDNSEDILTRFFIVKMPLTNKVINESILIENEVRMYNEVIPRIYEVAQVQVFPKSYPCSLPDSLVLEDLSVDGYKMCDAITKLDFKHTKATLVTLAKFHAATVAVKRKHPELIAHNGIETVYTHEPKYADRFKPRILMRLYGVAKVLQTIEGCERFGDILIDAGEAFWDLTVELFKPNSKLNVLNHGDFWTNNILFKYGTTGIISNVKFIDYQMRRYCSPAIDLLYLFWTSTDDAARMRMYELLEMYRHTLNSSLAELACPERLSRQELKEEISKHSAMILLICLYLPVIFPDQDTMINLNNFEESDENMTSTDFNTNPILIPFKGTYFRTALPEMCKELETMKIFQILIKNKK